MRLNDTVLSDHDNISSIKFNEGRRKKWSQFKKPPNIKTVNI